jgi:hypothetical protein
MERFVIHGLGHGTPLATLGPDGCGATGPFLLEAGVSSSLQIAKFWGVANVVNEAASTSARAEPKPRAASAKPQPKPELVQPFASSPWRAPQPKTGRTLKSVLKALGLGRR